MAREVTMTVENNTGKKLELKDKDAIHGKFTTKPPTTIESTGYWVCTTVSGGTIGPKGTVTYEAADKSFTVEFFYNHPYGPSTSSYRVDPSPRDAIGYDILGDFEGHTQDITFQLFPA